VRKINRVFWHCSGTPEGRDVKTETIKAWHTNRAPKGRGWLDIGYHFVYELDGTEHPGRPLERVGAGVRGHNDHSIHLCYVGGLASDAKTPKDTRTPAQREAMYRRTQQLLEEFPEATVHGHNEFDAKACPSFDVQKDWAAYLDDRDGPATDPAGLKCPHCGESLTVTVSV